LNKSDKFLDIKLEPCFRCGLPKGCAYGDINNNWLIFCFSCNAETDIYDDKKSACDEWNKLYFKKKK